MSVIGYRGWLPFRYSSGQMGLRSVCANCVWHGPEVGPPHTPRAAETVEKMARIWGRARHFVYGTVELFGAQRDWEYYAKRAVVRSLYIVGLRQASVVWTYDQAQNNVYGALVNQVTVDVTTRGDMARGMESLAARGIPLPTGIPLNHATPMPTPIADFITSLEVRYQVPVVRYTDWNEALSEGRGEGSLPVPER